VLEIRIISLQKGRDQMSEARLVMVSVGSIDPNPMRKLKRYPYNKDRLANLLDSIEDVGFFEGVHARKVASRYQLAFGHHRIEACRKHGLKKVPLLVGDYSDEDMLKMLSRENDDVGEGRMEVFQEVWEAALLFYADELKVVKEEKEQTAFLARKLGGGWTVKGCTPAGTPKTVSSQRALACAKVISLGLDPKQFTGVSARTANEVVTKAQSLEKKASKAVDQGLWTPAKAEKAASAIWSDVARLLQVEADPQHNPGRKLGYRAVKAELDELWADKIPKPATESKPKPIEKVCDQARQWSEKVDKQAEEQYGKWFDAFRFAEGSNASLVETEETVNEWKRLAKSISGYANRMQAQAGRVPQGLRSVK